MSMAVLQKRLRVIKLCVMTTEAVVLTRSMLRKNQPQVGSAN